MDLNWFDENDRMYAAYFVSTLHRKWINWKAGNDGFIRLKYKYITRVIPKAAWKRIVAILEEKGVIEICRNAIPSVRAFGYRLCSEYWSSRQVAFVNTKFAAKLQKRRAHRHVDVHRELQKRLSRVSIEVDRANAIIDTMHPDPAKSKITTEEYRAMMRETVKRIDGGDMTLVVDAYGRVHTPLTSLHKKLRCCLQIDGKYLISIDAANSQPLILAILVSQALSSREAKRRLKEREFNKDGSAARQYPAVSPVNRSAMPSDAREYLELCEAGQLYEKFASKKQSRVLAKQRFIVMLYDRQRAKPGPMRRQFAEKYPTVASVLDELKLREYQHGARLSQNVEASLFIGRIARRIIADHPEIVFFTGHDSISTTADWIATIKQIVIEEFSRLNIKPELKEVNHDPNRVAATRSSKTPSEGAQQNCEAFGDQRRRGLGSESISRDEKPTTDGRDNAGGKEREPHHHPPTPTYVRQAPKQNVRRKPAMPKSLSVNNLTNDELLCQSEGELLRHSHRRLQSKPMANEQSPMLSPIDRLRDGLRKRPEIGESDEGELSGFRESEMADEGEIARLDAGWHSADPVERFQIHDIYSSACSAAEHLMFTVRRDMTHNREDVCDSGESILDPEKAKWHDPLFRLVFADRVQESVG